MDFKTILTTLVTIVVYVTLNYLFKIVYQLLQNTQFFIKRYIDRRAKIQKGLEGIKKENLKRHFLSLKEFVDWVNKQLPNRKLRKKFWSDWASSPEYQKQWIDRLLKQFEDEKKENKNVERVNY